MKVSITKAATLAGVSRTTLYTDMDNGKLSYNKTGKNRRNIDVSELERVYGSLKVEGTKKVSTSDKPEQKLTKKDEQPSGGLIELAVLREKVELLESERRRERDQLQDRIESLENSMRKAETEKTYLLEYQKNKEGEGTNFDAVLKPIQDEISQLKSASEIEKTKSEELAKEKSDLKKANMVYAGLAFVIVVGVGIFALMQSGIIQIN